MYELTWLAGRWENEESSETWTPPCDGQMLGVSQSLRAGKPPFFEFIRIEVEEGRITYFASPGGRTPATPFPLVKLDHQSVEFCNAENEFPQIIRYWRVGDELSAEVEGSGLDGKTRPIRWVWKKVAM
jgi:hypothetical protein